MYVQPRPDRKSPVPRIAFLSLLVVVSVWFLRQIIDGQGWARPFDPTPTPTQPAIFHVNQGDIHLAEGKLQQAVEAYRQAIQLEPDNDIPYRQLGHLFIFTGDTAQALVQAEQAVRLNPTSPENLAGYCQALDWEGQYGAAADACECAMELDPNYAPAYAYLSETYADQGLWGPARTTAQQAIDVDFQNPVAHHNMGYALEVQGRYKEAIEFYENAITLRPNLAPYYVSAGQAYFALGDYEKAADRFGKAIKLNPTDPVAYDQIGWTYSESGEYSRAIDALEQAITVDANHVRAWGRLATIYYLRQNYEEAIKTYPIAIELAENQFLRKIREIEVLTEIESVVGLEYVPILRGRFEADLTSSTGNLVAQISPLVWAQRTAFTQDEALTCGHLIARNIQSQVVRSSPTQNITFSETFSQTQGTATLNMVTGDLTISLDNVPQVTISPYQVQIKLRSAAAEVLDFIQPDSANHVEAQITIEGGDSAPVSYYYGLGLSHTYIDPPQCEAAIPWLITSVKIDPSYLNPGWAGFQICQTDEAPPTPLPTFTPLPTTEP